MVAPAETVNLVAEILEIDSSTVSLDDSLEELGWDSLSDLGFIAAADERYGVTVPSERLSEAKTPADLAALLNGSAA